MSLLSLLLVLLVAGVVIYGVKLALAGNWKNLVLTVVVLILVLWVLSMFGISLPNLPVK